MKRHAVSIALIVVAAAVLAWPRLVANRPPSVAAQPKPAPQGVEPAPRPVVAAGLVEPVGEQLKIGSQLDGRLQRVLVDEGSPVRRGMVLAVLENADYQARVELAKAQVAEREAALERLLNGSRQEERREAQAAIREAQVVAEIARNERSRRQTLLDRGAISRTEFDQADRECRVAEARLEAARERFAFVDAAARRDEVLRAEAEIARARAQLAEAEAVLAKTFLRSPIDGVVLRRYLQSGESVSASGDTPVVALGDTSRLRVRVDVDESDVARLAIGQPAYVTAEAYPKRRFHGKVVRIGQALGRKNVRTDEPTERIDTKILETLIELNEGERLPVGLRVDAYLEAR